MTEENEKPPIDPSKADLLKGLFDMLGSGVDPMSMLLETLEVKPLKFSVTVQAKQGSLYLKVDMK